MIIYVENADGSLSEGGRTIPPSNDNRDYVIALEQINLGDASIDAYAGSSRELDDGKEAKSAEVVREWESRAFSFGGYTVPFAQMKLYEDIYTANGAGPDVTVDTLIANRVLCTNAISTVQGLPDITAVNNYSASADPGWTF